MLQTVGVVSKIRPSHDSGLKLLPNGKDGYANFMCKATFRLLINSNYLEKLISIGFNPHRLDVKAMQHPNSVSTKFVKVEQIERTGRFDATYCLTEPIHGMAVFNGILTGNCAEINLYTSNEEVAVCNLASIALPRFVKQYETTGKFHFDYEHLHEVARFATRNVDRTIDINKYPLERAKVSNFKHRPIGIGVQGLADVYAMLRIPFDSEEARSINRHIFETIQHGCWSMSVDLAKKFGPYESFKGSPASEGVFQHDMWKIPTSDLYMDWEPLRADLIKYGSRNSVVTALMPTASTAQILGNNESFEPFVYNMYVRRVLAGSFEVFNKYLVADLLRLDLWTPEIREQIVESDGSIQSIEAIPVEIRDLYKTAWEIRQRDIIQQSIDRAPFVDQTQSLNLFVSSPNATSMTKMHMFAWENGLKTGSYYIHTRTTSKAVQFGLTPKDRKNKIVKAVAPACSSKEDCVACSS